MDSNLDIPLPEESVIIVKRCGVTLCNIINSKFGCVASIEGLEFENKETSYQRPPPTISPEKRFEYKLRSGVKVSVLKADLTNFQVDAVVNAANEHLKHYGGLAQALSSAGGSQIQRESDDFVKNHGKLKTGGAVVLSSGSLPCKMIIHAVGPELPVDPPSFEVEKAKPLLRTAIRNILNIVEKYQLATVAIPAISSGLFHYPLPDCAHTIVLTIKHCYENLPYQNHRPQEIFLANHDEPTVQEMEKACRQIFCAQQQHQSYSQAAGKNPRSNPNTYKPKIQIGTVFLTLKKGHIEEQRTDVIVNTASRDRNLKTGNISSAINAKAGYELQNEIWKADMKGYIIRTRGYKLNCKEVFHTFCIEKKNGPVADQTLYSSVHECLFKAAQAYNSITFPAIGTGALGFSKAESARIMLQAVNDFAQKCQKRLEVYFVIFPSDTETFQAFEREIEMFQKRSASHNFPVGWSPEVTGAGGSSSYHSPQQHPPAYFERLQGHHWSEASGPKDESHSSRALTPHISLHGDEVSKHEAEKWLSDHLFMRSRSIKIYNNFLLHFSEQDHQQLALWAEQGPTIEEFLSRGHAIIEINGKSKEDIAVAALEVEAMLCQIQNRFISEEKHDLEILSQTELFYKREEVDKSSWDFSRLNAFTNHGLKVIKVEKLDNSALKAMFDMKKKQLHCSSSQKSLQRIPAQFCDMISQIGFQAECAPPDDPVYGEGIYFAHKIKKALEMWKEKGEEYLYFVEAEVLTGNSAFGKPGMILPPPVGNDPSIIHDSVGGPEVSVIFSGYQALPTYIIVCKKG